MFPHPMKGSFSDYFIEILLVRQDSSSHPRKLEDQHVCVCVTLHAYEPGFIFIGLLQFRIIYMVYIHKK